MDFFHKIKLSFDFIKVFKYLNKTTFSPAHLTNRLRLMQAYRQRKSEINAYPRVLQIETTSACNLKCVMCPRKSMTRKAEHMSLDLFCKIIDQSAGRSEIAILHLMGDPLLNPEIYKMIAYCRKFGLRTVISTNGMALTKKACSEIYESGLDIILLSFDGGSKEIFEKVRVGANFEQVVKSYRNFLEMQKDYTQKIRPVIQMIKFKTTKEETEAFYKLWNGFKADVIIKPFTRWQGDNEIINKLMSFNPSTLENSLCDRAWQWLTVISDGTVIPCCRDYDATVRLGNLKEQSVEELWNSSAFTSFRKMHAAGRSKANICRKCDYKALVADSNIAQIGRSLLDDFTVISLMYDLHYLEDE